MSTAHNTVAKRHDCITSLKRSVIRGAFVAALGLTAAMPAQAVFFGIEADVGPFPGLTLDSGFTPTYSLIGATSALLTGGGLTTNETTTSTFGGASTLPGTTLSTLDGGTLDDTYGFLDEPKPSSGTTSVTTTTSGDLAMSFTESFSEFDADASTCTTNATVKTIGDEAAATCIDPFMLLSGGIVDQFIESIVIDFATVPPAGGLHATGFVGLFASVVGGSLLWDLTVTASSGGIIDVAFVSDVSLGLDDAAVALGLASAFSMTGPTEYSVSDYVLFDDVTLIVPTGGLVIERGTRSYAAVSEPQALLLMAAGLLLMAGSRRKLVRN